MTVITGRQALSAGIELQFRPWSNAQDRARTSQFSELRGDSHATRRRLTEGERGSVGGRSWRYAARASAPRTGEDLNRVSQDPGYRRLKDHLIALTGLAFYADRDNLLTELIDERLSSLGLPDCSRYVEFLREGAEGLAETETIIAQLTIGENYFFRDEAQFAAIGNIVLPDILERNKASRQLRIWSAGCATGAEPYSLAILLELELADRIAGWQVGIYATDLNRGFLALAAEGKFREWALRSTSDEVKRKCFSNEGLIWTIDPRFKQWISFEHRNLIAGEFPTTSAAGKRFDLILCRNVMIYFAPEVSRRMVGQFHESLEDGGWLVVGASEYNLESYKAFRTISAPAARLYQKPFLPGERLEVAAKPPEPRKPIGQPPAPDRPDMQGLRHLADRGDWRRAADYCQGLLAHDKLNPEIHFYRGLIFENLGIVDESERSLRQAIYLDRRFALAHYHLGLALKQSGQTGEAARSFENVLRVLAGMPGNAIVTAGPGVRVTDLTELARMQLEGSWTR